MLGSVDSPRSDADAQRVRASEERLTSALRSGRTVAWEWDLLTDRVIRSENCVELLGRLLTIEETLARMRLSPADACRVLVEEAYGNGGRDNITVVVIRAKTQP